MLPMSKCLCRHHWHPGGRCGIKRQSIKIIKGKYAYAVEVAPSLYGLVKVYYTSLSRESGT